MTRKSAQLRHEDDLRKRAGQFGGADPLTDGDEQLVECSIARRFSAECKDFVKPSCSDELLSLHCSSVEGPRG